MSNGSSQIDGVARRYGKVLFSLSQDEKKEKEILKDVEALLSVVAHDSRNWLLVSNMSVTEKDQKQVVSYLNASLKLNKLTENFLKLIVQKRRLSYLQGMLTQFMRCYQAEQGRVEGVVKTVTPLAKSAMENLTKALNEKLGMTVDLQPETDPSILGGAVVRIGSIMIDASLGTQLNKLRQTMKG